MSVVVDSLNSGEFPSFDPVHQLPWALTFVCDFLNFIIEEGSLDIFDSLFELFLVFETSWWPIIVKRPFTLVGPPLFGVFGNFWFFCVFSPSLVDNHSELIDYLFQLTNIFNVGHIQRLEVRNDVLDEVGFLVAFWSQGELQCLNDLFDYRNIDW